MLLRMLGSRMPPGMIFGKPSMFLEFEVNSFVIKAIWQLCAENLESHVLCSIIDRVSKPRLC